MPTPVGTTKVGNSRRCWETTWTESTVPARIRKVVAKDMETEIHGSRSTPRSVKTVSTKGGKR